MGDIVIKWYKCVCLLVVIIIIVSCSLITPMTTSSTTMREKICEEIKPKVYEDKNKNKISMVGLNSEHMIVPIIEQKHSTSQISMLANTKKVEGIKKNNIEVLKNHGSEVLAHNILNNKNFIKDTSDNSTLADNLSSIYSLLEKDANEIEFSENL